MKKKFLAFTEDNNLSLYLMLIGLTGSVFLGGRFLGDNILHLSYRKQDWLQYLLMGTVIPFFALLLILFRVINLVFLWQILKSVFSLCGLVFLFLFISGFIFPISLWEYFLAFGLSLLQVCVWAIMYRQKISGLKQDWAAGTKIFMFSMLLFCLWLVGLRLITHRYGWFDNLYSIEWWLWPGWPGISTTIWSASFLRRMTLVILVTLVVTFYFTFPCKTIFTNKLLGENHKLGFRVIDILFYVVFGFISIKTERILNSDIQNHIDFFLGPLIAVKQGAWLLWDQPSPYGFLWVFIASLIPISSATVALSFFLWFLNFCLAVILYQIFCLLNPLSVAHRFIAFILVITSFLIRLFANQDLEMGYQRGGFTDAFLTWYWVTPVDIPQSGAIRTIVCCILLFVASQYLSRNSKDFQYVSIVGSFFWAIGCLWSAESAIFCTATWIPCLIANSLTERKFIRLTLPIFFLCLLISFFSVYYYVNIGNLPEWSSLFEFISTSGVDVDIHPRISITGPVWSLISILIVAIMANVWLVLKNWRDPAIGVGLACFGAIWSVSSYYMGDSHNSKLIVLYHVYAGACMILLKIIHSRLYNLSSEPKFFLLPQASITIFLILVIVCGVDIDRAGLKAFSDTLFNRKYSYWDTRSYRSGASDSLNQLLAEASITSSDKIMLADSMGNLPRWQTKEGQDMLESQIWLPMVPSLPEDRKKTYIVRFSNRLCQGGWLIIPSADNPSLGNEFLWQINSNLINKLDLFEKTKKYENEDWSVFYFQPNTHSLLNCNH